ncbi:phage head-tail connector protein [Rhizobiaceae bacterium BDR2-2]|uniref:Phage head-tail connector protein n=1 Tax=Ectorhizobium quercum TaxID=2965071 RepID=A0AAE3SVL0_9HYPH|nr:phage head-tail connector protein [Ectorhizobium quercum]MCX8998465.1 phage head-tail connector protein [Ectorhizobium quercum]
MTYATIAPPAVEPLTLAGAKAHLRLDGAEEDALILSLIATARDHLERETGLCLIGRTMRLYRDRWPPDGVLDLDHGPVTAVSAVTVYDDAGDASAVSLEGHRLDGTARPARLWLKDRPAPGAALNGIEVDFVAGFGETGADVPDALKRAMLEHVALMFTFRGAVAAENQPAAVPEGYDRLVAPWRIRRL